jgi:hypothetical protein
MGVKVRQDPKDGAYYVHIHHKNKRKSKKIGVGGEARKRAESIAEKIRAKLVLGEFSLDVPTAPPVPLVEEYSKSWLAD